MLQFLNQDLSVKYITFHFLNVTTFDDNFKCFMVFIFLTFMIFIIDVWPTHGKLKILRIMCDTESPWVKFAACLFCRKIAEAMWLSDQCINSLLRQT